jgi:hypothetical protein
METTADVMPIPSETKREAPRSRHVKFYEPYPTSGQLALVAFMPLCIGAIIVFLVAITPAMVP